MLLAINSLTHANFDSQYGFLKLKQQAIETGWYLPAYYTHVLISGIILVIGLFLVFPSSRRFPRTHRFLGYIYVMGILFFAAPGALGMSLFIQRGPWVLASFLLQGILWFYFTAVAFDRIRKKILLPQALDVAKLRIDLCRRYAAAPCIHNIVWRRPELAKKLITIRMAKLGAQPARSRASLIRNLLSLRLKSHNNN